MSLNALQHARDVSVQHFWSKNRDLFEQAWSERETRKGAELPQLDTSLFDTQLRGAVEQAWADPTTESGVKNR